MARTSVNNEGPGSMARAMVRTRVDVKGQGIVTASFIVLAKTFKCCVQNCLVVMIECEENVARGEM